jgi:hypothetical protein
LRFVPEPTTPEADRRYYKKAVAQESGLGEGEVFFEYHGDVPVRQVERYGDRWFDSRREYHDELGPGLVDQPPLAVGLSPDDEISAQKFEAAWAASTQANP